MSITGWPDSPPTRSGTAIGDILSALFCCIGILSALKVREQTGKGQAVDVSLVDSVFASAENIPQKVFIDGEVPTRIGNRYEFVYPYGSFRTVDGWVILGIANDAIWRRFVEATGMLHLLDDERFSSNLLRVENHAELAPHIEGWTSKLTVPEVVTLLTEHGVPACPIYNLKEAAEDPHIGGVREMTVEMEQPGLGMIKLMGNPIKMSETRPYPKGPAPGLGEDNRSVLSELLGLPEAELERLRREGVI